MLNALGCSDCSAIEFHRITHTIKLPEELFSKVLIFTGTWNHLHWETSLRSLILSALLRSNLLVVLYIHSTNINLFEINRADVYLQLKDQGVNMNSNIDRTLTGTRWGSWNWSVGCCPGFSWGELVFLLMAGISSSLTPPCPNGKEEQNGRK